MLNLLNLVGELTDKNVLVLGDVGVDEFIYGISDRICPEAPVPIFEERSSELVPGLAGNVAANIASLGGKVYLLGVTGDDQNRLDIEEALASKSVDSSHLLSDAQRRTTKKKRFVVNSRHQILRIDEETRHEINELQERELLKRFHAVMDQMDVVVISDYGKGVVTQGLLKAITSICGQQNKITICDPKPNGKNSFKYSNIDYLTPNRKEAAMMYEEFVGKESDDPVIMNHEIKNCLLNKAVITTLGPKGICVTSDSECLDIPAVEQKVYDVCGAGDTVIATLALAIAAKASLFDAAKLANFAASIAVSRFGTTTISNEELYSGLAYGDTKSI